MQEFTKTHLAQISEFYKANAQKDLDLKLLKKVYEKALADRGEQALYDRATKHLTPEQVRTVLNDLEKA